VPSAAQQQTRYALLSHPFRNQPQTDSKQITSTGNTTKPFAVAGSTFSDFQSAVTRSCNNQHNACSQIANNGGDKTLTVGDCDTQQTNCLAQSTAVTTAAGVAATATSSAQPTFKSADANFFYYCDP
jgi:hypothetical protein